MRGINKVYLGWGNPKSAFSIVGHDVVVLTDPANNAHTVLEGQAAIDFRTDMTDLNNHLFGIRSSAKAAALIESVPAHPHELTAYDAVFYRHFKSCN